MISVLIPTYNYKCYTLVQDLQRQLALTGEQYEVLVAEDGGKDQVVAISNLRINELPHCRYIRRYENVGRSAIRNFLADEAKGDWLMFLDSDGLIIHDDFIQKYIDATKEGCAVVCGGITHSDKCPSNEQSLRWRYEKDYERHNGVVGDNFRSFCFMIRKDAFLDVRFDEKYRLYGWEDVQFGLDLKKHGHQVLRIDNPLLNNDLETNLGYLEKTEEALVSLHKFEKTLQGEINLLRFVSKLRKYHVTPLISSTFKLSKPFLRKNLLGPDPDLNIFAFYKLGYFLSL